MRSSLPPLLSQFFFLEFSVLRHLGILGWLGFTEPWRFCFPGLTKIGLASSLVGRFAESYKRNVRGKEVADQEDNMGSCQNPRRQQPTTQHVAHTPHFNISKKTTMDCVFSCFVCLSGTLFWDGNKAMTYGLFCFSLALETYKEAWSRNHNTPLRLNKTRQRGGTKRGKKKKKIHQGKRHNPPSPTSSLPSATPLKRARPQSIPFVERTHNDPDVHGWNQGGTRRPRKKKRTTKHACMVARNHTAAQSKGGSLVCNDLMMMTTLTS